jgi:hypothetical protein
VRVALRGGDGAVVVEIGGGAVAVVVLSAEVVVVSVLVVVVVVGVLVVGSVVVGGESARAAAAAPLPKRTTVASVGTSLFATTTPDYRRIRRAPVEAIGRPRHPRSYPHARATDRPSGARRGADWALRLLHETE